MIEQMLHQRVEEFSSSFRPVARYPNNYPSTIGSAHVAIKRPAPFRSCHQVINPIFLSTSSSLQTVPSSRQHHSLPRTARPSSLTSDEEGYGSDNRSLDGGYRSSSDSYVTLANETRGDTQIRVSDTRHGSVFEPIKRQRLTTSQREPKQETLLSRKNRLNTRHSNSREALSVSDYPIAPVTSGSSESVRLNSADYRSVQRTMCMIIDDLKSEKSSIHQKKRLENTPPPPLPERYTTHKPSRRHRERMPLPHECEKVSRTIPRVENSYIVPDFSCSASSLPSGVSPFSNELNNSFSRCELLQESIYDEIDESKITEEQFNDSGLYETIDDVLDKTTNRYMVPAALLESDIKLPLTPPKRRLPFSTMTVKPKKDKSRRSLQPMMLTKSFTSRRRHSMEPTSKVDIHPDSIVRGRDIVDRAAVKLYTVDDVVNSMNQLMADN